jgi:hypothetical protein
MSLTPPLHAHSLNTIPLPPYPPVLQGPDRERGHAVIGDSSATSTMHGLSSAPALRLSCPQLSPKKRGSSAAGFVGSGSPEPAFARRFVGEGDNRFKSSASTATESLTATTSESHNRYINMNAPLDSANAFAVTTFESNGHNSHNNHNSNGNGHARRATSSNTDLASPPFPANRSLTSVPAAASHVPRLSGSTAIAVGGSAAASAVGSATGSTFVDISGSRPASALSNKSGVSAGVQSHSAPMAMAMARPGASANASLGGGSLSGSLRADVRADVRVVKEDASTQTPLDLLALQVPGSNPRNRFAITSLSLYYRFFAIASLSLRYHFAITLLSPYYRFAIALLSLRYYYIVSSLSLCNTLVITL